MGHTTEDTVRKFLMQEADGLSAPELLQRMKYPVSQPTLWRLLDRMRAEGSVTVTGKARATRYRLSSVMDRQALRSLYMHRSVARRIVDDPTLISKVHSRLEKLAIVNPHGRRYHDQWREILAGPVENLLRIITEDSLEARDLRKESPLSCLVTSEERIAAYRWVS